MRAAGSYENKRSPSCLPFPEAAPISTKFRVESKMGMKPVLHCPCGASIQFPRSQGPIPSREMRQFLEQHADCQAREEEESA